MSYINLQYYVDNKLITFCTTKTPPCYAAGQLLNLKINNDKPESYRTEPMPWTEFIIESVKHDVEISVGSGERLTTNIHLKKVDNEKG